MPAAARVADSHVCPKAEDVAGILIPHVGGPIEQGAPTVMIGYMPAAREGDQASCLGKPAKISRGEPTVKICGKSAARMGDMTDHGGIIALGCLSVIIGSSAQAATLTAAAKDGTPFCEECEKARLALERGET